MSVVVVNRLTFRVPVDDVIPAVRERFPTVFDACPGFERFELLKVGEMTAIVLIHWADAQSATDGAARIGPTVDCPPCDTETATETTAGTTVHAGGRSPHPEANKIVTAGHTVPDAAPGPSKEDGKTTREKRRWRFLPPWRRTAEATPVDDQPER